MYYQSTIELDPIDTLTAIATNLGINHTKLFRTFPKNAFQISDYLVIFSGYLSNALVLLRCDLQ